MDQTTTSSATAQWFPRYSLSPCSSMYQRPVAMCHGLVLRGRGESSSSRPSLDAIEKDLKGTEILARFQVRLAVPEHHSCCFQIARHILKPRDIENLCSHMGECTKRGSQLDPNSPSHLCTASCTVVYCSVRDNFWHLWHFSIDILINGYVCVCWSWLI